MVTKLSEKQWDDFVKNHCLDDEMKKISYKELMENTNNGEIDFNKLALPENSTSDISLAISAGDRSCTLAIGYVVVDVACLAIGAVGIRSSISSSSVESVATVVESSIPEILSSVETIARSGSSALQRAQACWSIIKVVLKSPYKIFSAIFSSLPWYKKALAIAQACATIAAALLTDGAALIAEIVVELASFGFLVSDSVEAVSACKIS